MRSTTSSLSGAALLLLAGCAAATAPAPGAEELGISATRPITEIERATFAFPERGVWVSNELEGGHFSAAWMEGDSILALRSRPENTPINNSAWYAFKVWAAAEDTLAIRLTYEDGRHRYWPKIRRAAGGAWTPLDSAFVDYDPETRSAVLRLAVGPDTLWVAGQELRTSSFFEEWTGELAALPRVSRRQIATTPRGRPLHMLHAGAPDARRHVLFISRQHPPEVTGTKALVAFLEEMLGDSPLAREFRDRFQIHVVPLMNPDGVDLGHWRHNTGGVDLNRDWYAFLQPETRAVRDEFRRIMAQPGAELWFFADFHSTNRDVLYTLDRNHETRPAGVLDRWVDHLRGALPDYEVSDAPGGLGSPVSRNWAWLEFQAPGLIYEVGDNTDRALIRRVAEAAARGTMEILLEEWRSAETGGGT
jgi:cytosolic carboxypeptidase protein 6